MIKYFIYACICVGFASCSSQKNTNSMEDSSDKQKSEMESGNKILCENNSTNEYKLCLFYETIENVKYASFKIYEIGSDEIIYTKTKVRSVKWNSEFEVRVDKFTHMPTNEGADDYYLYDVKKKTKISNNKL